MHEVPFNIPHDAVLFLRHTFCTVFVLLCVSSPFADNKVVGVLWSTKVGYETFFGNEPEFIHGIQMLPFTPISEELLRQDWITQGYPSFSENYATTSDGWRGFMVMAKAIFNSQAAWNEAQALNSFDDGNSRTNTLYWIATRP